MIRRTAGPLSADVPPADSIIWIDEGLATIIASFCRHYYGADVTVPVAHWWGRRGGTMPCRSLGIDCRFADTVMGPRALHAEWTSGVDAARRGLMYCRSPVHRLAAEYVIRFREERPLGRDSLAVGFVCALVFLELNGVPCRPDEECGGRLVLRLAVGTGPELAWRLGELGGWER